MSSEALAPSKTRVTWGWLSPAAGITFSVLFLVGIMARGVMPEYTDSAESFASFFGDSGNRVQMIVGSYLMILAGFAFLWLLVSVYARIGSLAQQGSKLPTTVLASGLLFVGMLLLASIAMGTVAASMSFGGAPFPGAELAIQTEQLGFGILLVPGMLAASVFVASLSIAARKTGTLPSWLATAGLISAVILLFSPMFIPAVVLPLWILAVAIVSLRRQDALV